MAPHDGKQVVLEDGKKPDGGLEVLAKEDLYAHGFGGHHVPAHRQSRGILVLLGGMVVLIVVLAVVLGTVFG